MPKRVNYDQLPSHLALEKRLAAYDKLEEYLQQLTVQATEMMYYFADDQKVMYRFLYKLDQAVQLSSIQQQRHIIKQALRSIEPPHHPTTTT